MVRASRILIWLVIAAAIPGATGCRYRTPEMSRTDEAMMNERWAVDALNRIARAEYLWRQQDMDGDGVRNFYVEDLGFLEGQPGRRASPGFDVPEGVIRADQGRFGASAEPYHGYFFSAMSRNSEGLPYRNDQRFEFAFVAWPAGYRDTGIRTFLVSEVGKVWARDHAGAPQTVWPEPDPATRGWVEGTYPGWSKSFPTEK